MISVRFGKRAIPILRLFLPKNVSNFHHLLINFIDTSNSLLELLLWLVVGEIMLYNLAFSSVEELPLSTEEQQALAAQEMLKSCGKYGKKVGTNAEKKWLTAAQAIDNEKTQASPFANPSQMAK
jgi:hypothetical protein